MECSRCSLLLLYKLLSVPLQRPDSVLPGTCLLYKQCVVQGLCLADSYNKVFWLEWSALGAGLGSLWFVFSWVVVVCVMLGCSRLCYAGLLRFVNTVYTHYKIHYLSLTIIDKCTYFMHIIIIIRPMWLTCEDDEDSEEESQQSDHYQHQRSPGDCLIGRSRCPSVRLGFFCSSLFQAGCEVFIM